MALDKEFDFYLAKQAEFAQKHYGEFVVIVGTDIIGFYPSEDAAIKDASAKFAPGAFLVEHCLPGKDHYTATFYTGRVTFA